MVEIFEKHPDLQEEAKRLAREEYDSPFLDLSQYKQNVVLGEALRRTSNSGDDLGESAESPSGDGEPPDEIYLQWHGNADPVEDGEVDPSQVTWSCEEVYDRDICYVREEHALNLTRMEEVDFKVIAAAISLLASILTVLAPNHKDDTGNTGGDDGECDG